jgi:hypothetical protein
MGKGVRLETFRRGVTLTIPLGQRPTLQTIGRGIVLQVRGSPGGRGPIGQPLQPQFQLSAGPPSPLLKRRDEAAAEPNPAAGSAAVPPADATLSAGAEQRVVSAFSKQRPPLPAAPLSPARPVAKTHRPPGGLRLRLPWGCPLKKESA